MNSIDVVV